jgi:hypothetical protein
MLFTYNCKKTGKTIDVDTDTLPTVSNEYGLRRGLREYFDNYHASYTKDGRVTPKGKLPYDAPATFESTVNDSIDEALDRLVAGDVPGARVAADPHVQKARKLAKELSDSEMEAALEWIMKKRARAA